jgi:hypothetical protein
MRILLLVLASIFISSLTLQAQLTKEETKIWKSKLKEMDPIKFKQLIEEKDEAEANVQSLKGDNETLLTKVNQLDVENQQLKTEVSDYQRAAKEAADRLASEKVAADSAATASGTTSKTYGMYSRSTATGDLVYKVQIGAFKKFDITKYFNNHKNFSGDIDDDGTMKYTLGEFPDYWEADKFKQFVRDMGVAGAWVVAYKGGKRVSMKDAREGSL